MTNKNNRYASFLLPTIFYKFHASKHIMILRYFKGKKIFKNLDQHWFKTMLYSSYIYIAYILQRKTHILYIRKYV